MSDQSKDYTRMLVDKSNKYLKAFSYEKITVTGAYEVLTVPAGATYCDIRVESASAGVVMRYRFDGVPTINDGVPLSNLDFIDITGADNMATFKVISTAGSHTIHVTYWK
jgi:hypothetical protein